MTPQEPTAHYYDVGAVTIWLASFANMLPSIAALLSIIWFLIRIAESETVQSALGKYRWIKETKDGKGNDI